MSSSRPGASPITISRAAGLPSAKTRLRAPSLSAQPSKDSIVAFSAARSEQAAASAAAPTSPGVCAGAGSGAVATAGTGRGSAPPAAKRSTGASPIASSAPSSICQASAASRAA